MKRLVQIVIGLGISFLLFQNLPRAGDEVPLEITGLAMGISYKVLIGHHQNQVQIQKINKILAETFAEIDQTYNKWNPFSEVSELNRLPKGVQRKLSLDLYAFLKRMNILVDLSDGRFDPTIETAQALWKSKLNQGLIPSLEEVCDLKNKVGWQKIHYDQGYFYKDHYAIQLDFGGVAKGLCVDLLIERLMEAGYSNLFVEWGGELRVNGEHPSGRSWNIYVSRFENPDPSVALVHFSLNEGAIATSGNYFQYWTVNDPSGSKITYTHVFNPNTCMPLVARPDSIASASIFMQCCETADALAKVFLTFDHVEEAQIWAEKVIELFPQSEYWIGIRSEHGK